ncbi:MAG TPA: Rad52/Rad22 family DNA repair protein [Pyrinomonadaceae bacterium]|nr:Rad52/Rad22 family DNA repair protein [Pyrinomonadaceae bacterium]
MTKKIINGQAVEAEAIAQPGNILDFGSTLQKLRKNVDPELVRTREAGRRRNGEVQTVEYVEWHTVADVLDQTAPNWMHSIKEIRKIGEIVAITVAVTIDGVTREGIGTGTAKTETGIKKAEHDALKRAAVKFGIARDLYKREFDEIDRGAPESIGEDRPFEATGFPAEPIAASLSELVTAKQLGMIRAIGRESGIDTESECRLILKCDVSELSKRAASAFIDHLMTASKRMAAMSQPVRRAG